MFRPAWETRNARSVIASDAAVIVVVCTVGLLLGTRVTEASTGAFAVVIGPIVAVVLLLATHLVGGWDPVVLGDGDAEYRRLVRSLVCGR